MSSRPPAKFFVNQGVVTSRTDMLHLLRPLLKQTVTYRYLRGREVVSHGTGWVERIVVDADDIVDLLHARWRSPSTSTRSSISSSRRAPTSCSSTRSSRATSGSSSSSRRSARRRRRLAVRPASARVRHQRLRPDGAARPRSPRGRVADPEGRTGDRLGGSRERDREGRSRVRRAGAARARPMGLGAPRPGRGGLDPVSAEAQPRTPAARRIDRRPRRLLQVRRTRHEPRHRGQGRPDHVHGHGLHPRS